MSRLLRRPTTVVGSVFFILAATVAFVAGAAGRADAAPYCGIRWGSSAKSGGEASEWPLGAVRTGRHDCFDRVVFEFAGPADGYAVEYVPQVRTEGEGRVLDAAGGAVLRVWLSANVFDQLGHIHYNRTAGQHVAPVRGYRTLRDVVYGGSFEGRTTFAVGVRARLPFRVFTLAGPGTHSRIVLDVAHRW